MELRTLEEFMEHNFPMNDVHNIMEEVYEEK